MDGLEFREFTPGRWVINYEGNAVGRITDENGGCHEVIMIQNDPYTQHPYIFEIIKASWEKARLLDVTRRLLK